MRTWRAFALLLLYSASAASHHAEAIFDRHQTLTVTGTVKEFLWANPHVLVYLEIRDASGHMDVSAFEAGSVTVMTGVGWASNSLHAGEALVLTFHPRRDRKPGGQLLTATLANGKTLGWQPGNMR
jgi:hypothetical protein